MSVLHLTARAAAGNYAGRAEAGSLMAACARGSQLVQAEEGVVAVRGQPGALAADVSAGLRNTRAYGEPTSNQNPGNCWVVTLVDKPCYSVEDGWQKAGYVWCDDVQPAVAQQHMLLITESGEIGGRNDKSFALKLHQAYTWPGGTLLRIVNRGRIQGKGGAGGNGESNAGTKVLRGGPGGGGGAGLNANILQFWGVPISGGVTGVNCSDLLWLDGWGGFGYRDSAGPGNDNVLTNPSKSCSGGAGAGGGHAIIANDPVEIDNSQGKIYGGGGGGGGSKVISYPANTTGSGAGGDPGEDGEQEYKPGVGYGHVGGSAGDAIQQVSNATWIGDQGDIKGAMT